MCVRVCLRKFFFWKEKNVSVLNENENMKNQNEPKKYMKNWENGLHRNSVSSEEFQFLFGIKQFFTSAYFRRLLRVILVVSLISLMVLLNHFCLKEWDEQSLTTCHFGPFLPVFSIRTL